MTQHKPVMLAEVIEAIAPKKDGVYIDATFGRGGYSRAVLQSADCLVLAIDQDPDAQSTAQDSFFCGKLTFILGRFSALATLASDNGFPPVDGVMFDLGLSSPQIDTAERGFSFSHDGPLDMRMGKVGLDAKTFINTASEGELKRVLRDYGEELKAARIARAIVKARMVKPIERTGELASIIRACLPRPKPGQIDSATRSFQGIRIHINDELGELIKGLIAAEKILKPHGVLAVVSFHSLEDRVVKRFILERSQYAARPSRHRPDTASAAPSFRIARRRPLTPSTQEIELNPRARSARLRIAIRTDAPPMPTTSIMEAA